jgi:WD40 repeat protein
MLKSVLFWVVSNSVVYVCFEVCVGFNPQSTQIATASMDTTARLWDVETGAETTCFNVSTDRNFHSDDFELNRHCCRVATCQLNDCRI